MYYLIKNFVHFNQTHRLSFAISIYLHAYWKLCKVVFYYWGGGGGGGGGGVFFFSVTFFLQILSYDIIFFFFFFYKQAILLLLTTLNIINRHLNTPMTICTVFPSLNRIKLSITNDKRK